MSDNRIAVGDFYLLENNSNKFEIKQHNYIENGYNRLSAFYKSFLGKFDKKTRRWVIPLFKHDILIEKANKEISDLIKFIPLKKEKLNIFLFAHDRQNFKILVNYKENDFLDMLNEERVQFEFEKDSIIVDYVYYDKIVNNIVRKYINNDLRKIPRGIVELVNGGRLEINNNNLVEIDHLKKVLHPTVFDALKDFQIEGILHAIHKNARMILADDMGLGKTLQSLAIASYYYEKWPLLIITTKTGIITWTNEINKWMNEFIRDRFDVDPKASIEDYIQIIEKSEDTDEFVPSSHIVLCTFGLVKEIMKNLKEFPHKFVIVDESHYIKNRHAQRSKSVIKLAKSCDHMLLLSGTPALSFPVELYTQIISVNPNLFDSAEEYEKRYCIRNINESGTINDYKGAKHLEELRLVLDQILLRREKLDLPNHFPRKIREITKIDPNLENETVAEKLRLAEKKYLKYKKMEKIEKSHTQTRKNKIVKKKKKHLLTFLGETCEVKMIPVCLYVKKLLEEEKKFIVVAFHNKMLDALEDVCKINGFEYIKFDGKASREMRETQLNEYHTNERVKIAILSFNTLFSLTLMETYHIIFAELWWTPGVMLQSEDRILRIGQIKSVKIEYLIAYNTADPHVYGVLKKKLNILNKMGLSKEEFPKISNFTTSFGDVVKLDDIGNLSFGSTNTISSSSDSEGELGEEYNDSLSESDEDEDDDNDYDYDCIEEAYEDSEEDDEDSEEDDEDDECLEEEIDSSNDESYRINNESESIYTNESLTQDNNHNEDEYGKYYESSDSDFEEKSEEEESTEEEESSVEESDEDDESSEDEEDEDTGIYVENSKGIDSIGEQSENTNNSYKTVSSGCTIYLSGDSEKEKEFHIPKRRNTIEDYDDTEEKSIDFEIISPRKKSKKYKRVGVIYSDSD